MNCILVRSNELDSQGRVVLNDSRSAHIRRVLRSSIGDSLRVGCLNGPLGRAVVSDLSEEKVTLECSFDSSPPPAPRIDLLLAMPRPKVIKRLWAQIAALGVGRIVLINAQRVERYYFDSHVIDPTYYEPLLVEGLQQACCTHLPTVTIQRRFKPFIEDELDSFFPEGKRLLADPRGQHPLLHHMQSTAPKDRFLLAIGPEGGWIPYELKQLETHNFKRFHAGPRILRTDTACVALLSALHLFEPQIS